MAVLVLFAALALVGEVSAASPTPTPNPYGFETYVRFVQNGEPVALQGPIVDAHITSASNICGRSTVLGDLPGDQPAAVSSLRLVLAFSSFCDIPAQPPALPVRFSAALLAFDATVDWRLADQTVEVPPDVLVLPVIGLPATGGPGSETGGPEWPLTMAGIGALLVLAGSAAFVVARSSNSVIP